EREQKNELRMPGQRSLTLELSGRRPRTQRSYRKRDPGGPLERIVRLHACYLRRLTTCTLERKLSSGNCPLTSLDSSCCSSPTCVRCVQLRTNEPLPKQSI